MPVNIRPATLDDTAAISALFRQPVQTWQRMNPAGRVEDVAYEALTIYQRWLHGGAWMSAETAALHLSHVLLGAGMPFVAESGGGVFGYMELYRGDEPPLGDHLHIGQLIGTDAVTKRVLLAAAEDQARALRCPLLSGRAAVADAETAEFYTQAEILPAHKLQRVTLPARAGQGFYKVSEHLTADAAQVNRWHLAVGGTGASRYGWEMRWPRTFHAVRELAERRVQRVRFSASGQEAFVYREETMYNPRQAEIWLWSPRPLSAQMLTALRDWTHRDGYRTLLLLMNQDALAVLGNEAEPDGYAETLFVKKIQ